MRFSAESRRLDDVGFRALATCGPCTSHTFNSGTSFSSFGQLRKDGSCSSIAVLCAIVCYCILSRQLVKLFKMTSKTKLNVQSFPRPPLLERTPRHLQIKWNGDSIIADTKDAYWVLETHHPPSNDLQ